MKLDDDERRRDVPQGPRRLTTMTAPQNRAIPITEDTEVFANLGIYGDEIVELFWWLNKEFYVELNIDPFVYAPQEAPFFQIVRPIKKMLGIVPQYKSLGSEPN